MITILFNKSHLLSRHAFVEIEDNIIDRSVMLKFYQHHAI